MSRAAEYAAGVKVKLVILSALTGLMFSSGCITYHPHPLSQRSVNRDLTPPSDLAISVAAESIHHPILKPTQIDFRQGLTPEQVGIVAVIVNPQLRAQRDQRAIAQAQVLQAGLLPNPQLAANVDLPYNAAPSDSFTAYGIGPSWDVTSLIGYARRQRAARASARSVDLEIAWSEWQTAEAAKTAAFDVLSLTTQLKLTRQMESELRRNFSLVRQAVDRHQKTLLDLPGADVAWREARLAALQIQQDLTHARLVLNHAIGLRPGAELRLAHMTLPSQLVPPTNAQLTDDLTSRRLDLLALKQGYLSQDATLRAAILEQFPKINVGFSAARDTTNVHTFGLGVSIDIPIFDRNQGTIAAERATRRRLYDEYLSRVFGARSDITIAASDIRSINTQIAATQTAVTQLRKLVQNFQSAVRQGNTDLFTFYATQRNLEQKEIDLQKLKQQLIENWIALEVASGQQIPLRSARGIIKKDP